MSKPKTVTLQIADLETGTENGVFWAKISGVTSRGRFPVKFRGEKASLLAEKVYATLQDGETVSGKRLFVEVEGGWESFVNAQGKNIRYYKPVSFDIVQGPSLELARIRSEATKTIQNAETLRKAGCLAQAYKLITEFTSELAQLPLDLSEMIEAENDLIGEIGEEDHNPEAAAAAYYLREERIEQEEAAAEQTEAPAPAPEPVDVDLDDIVLSNDEAVEDVADDTTDETVAEEEQSEEVLEAIRTGARIEAALAASALEEASAEPVDEDDILMDGSDHVEPDADSVDENEAEQDADTEAEAEAEEPSRPAPVRRMFGRRV